MPGAGASAFVLWAAMAATQAAPPAAQAKPVHQSRFGIPDNSFLIEEAFNQEKGIVQNTVIFQRTKSGNWDAGFTQEWPIGTERHQFAFTIPFGAADAGRTALGDAEVSYRLKITGDGPRFPAMTPEVALIVPTSAERRSAGWHGAGWAVSVPFSKELNYLFLHVNAGNEWLRADDGAGNWETTPYLAGSVVVAVRPMLNVMLEAYNEWAPGHDGRERSTTISPGVRFGWNTATDTQLVLGVGMPITRGAVHDRGILLYCSYELPFTKRR
jgi:hypothetical protein